MKKTRGKKKKVASSKKVKKFFFFNNKVAPVAFIFAILALAVLLIFVNHTTGNVISGYDAASTSGSPGTTINNFYGSGSSPSVLDNTAPTWVAVASNALGLGDTWKQIIIGIIILLIIFAGFYDIIELSSIITNNWVIAIIAAGLAIIFALIDVVRNIAAWLFALVATLGALGIAIEIIICIVIFVGLSFGSFRIAIFSAKRQAARLLAQGIRNEGKLRSGVDILKGVAEEANKNR